MIAPILVALALSLAAGPAAARAEPFDPLGAASADPRPGARVPLDRRFQDEAGRWTSLRELAGGRSLVLAPVQHRCPNLCGLTLEGLGRAVAGQSYRPGRDFVVVALGIDPRETPADAAASASSFGPAEAVHGLVGAAPDVAAVAGALNYRYAYDPRIGQYAHIAGVAVLTPDGRLARWLPGLAPKSADLQQALGDARRGRLGVLTEQVRMLCYHYAPEIGRYDGAVRAALRWGAALTVAGLAAAVGFGLLAERRRARRRP